MAVLFEAPHPARGAGASDAFTIRTPLSPAGHETLTERAAAPLVAAGRLAAADAAALVRGVRSVDLNPLNHVAPSRQRRHFLRATLCQPVATARREALGRLRTLFDAALAGSGSARWHIAGQALHLIQDSYSPAHAERVGDVGPIRFIRYYGLRGKPYPTEHKLPSDPRDHIATSTVAARASVRASNAFLHVVLRAAAPGATPAARGALFARYVRTFFPLDPAHRTTHSVYPGCPAPAVPGPGREAELEAAPTQRWCAAARAYAFKARTPLGNRPKSRDQKGFRDWLAREVPNIERTLAPGSPEARAVYDCVEQTARIYGLSGNPNVARLHAIGQ